MTFRIEILLERYEGKTIFASKLLKEKLFHYTEFVCNGAYI